MRKVSFFLMRHPEHDNDLVAEKGILQIQTAAKKLLGPFTPFVYAFCTEKMRARTTAREALLAIDPHFRVVLIDEEPDFGFQYIEDEVGSQYPWEKAIREIAERRAAGKFVSVRDVIIDLWPPALVIRHVLRVTMKGYAEGLTEHLYRNLRNSAPNQINVLVGNHASNVYATLTPDTTDGYPPYCSIAVYNWEVNDQGKAFLVSSDLLIP